MPRPPPPLVVAVVQSAAGRVLDANLADLEPRLSAAVAAGADVIALPEVFALRGSHADYRRHAQPLEGPIGRRLAAWARERQVWILAGSLIERVGSRLFNTCALFDRRGRRVAVYRKIHLFEARLDDGRRIREQDIYQPGRRPTLATIEGWRCGLAVCYDLRFPELFRHYSAAGAHLFFVPSNFTQRTGRDHWEVLVRARAIENQCFVVAPNQCGANPATGVVSHGHSLIVGPWGEVLAAAGKTPAVICARLDLAVLRETRARIPALRHRRL